MTTVTASHSCEAVFQNAAIQIAINDPFDVRTKEAVLPFEPRVINQLEGFEMALYALVVWRILRVVMTVYEFRHRAEAGNRHIYRVACTSKSPTPAKFR